MKCVRYKDGTVDRIEDGAALKLTNTGQAVYVPRRVWKEEVRDITQPQNETPNETELEVA